MNVLCIQWGLAGGNSKRFQLCGSSRNCSCYSFPIIVSFSNVVLTWPLSLLTTAVKPNIQWDSTHIFGILSFCSSLLSRTAWESQLPWSLWLLAPHFSKIGFPLLGPNLGITCRPRAQRNAGAPLICSPFLRDHSSVLLVLLCVKAVTSYTWSSFLVVFTGCNSSLTNSLMIQNEIPSGISFWNIWSSDIIKSTVLIEDNVQTLFEL